MMGSDELKRIRVSCYVVFMMIIWLGIDESHVQSAPQVPCFFVFGDSAADNGNNNDLADTIAKGNFLPYGIDFPAGSTGRFSNGLIPVDVIAQLLGFNSYPPSYATARGRDILAGVNYASAGAGIRDETGQHLGNRFSFNGQLRNFQNTTSQLLGLLGGQKDTANYLSRCIYAIGIGSNDYTNNYFMPSLYNTSNTYTLQQFTSVLIQQYSQQLKSLYNYGARKLALMGAGPLGCRPYELARSKTNGTQCVEITNLACRLFNGKLRGLVDNLNRSLLGASFIYVNIYDIFYDILRSASSYGFKVTRAACCGEGRKNAEIDCLPHITPCLDRKQYFFWDPSHPTEAANLIIGRRSYAAQVPSDAYPMDIQHLAKV